MMEIDQSSSPPIEENSIADENQGDNSNSIPGTIEQVTESGTPLVNDTEVWHDFKCVFCKQGLQYTKKPKLLQCLHTACEPCLKAAKESNSESEASSSAGNKQLTCPTCNQEIVINDVVDHLFLIEYIKTLEKLPEDCLCTCKKFEGKVFCLQCRDWLCETCGNAHTIVRITKDHTLRTKEEMKGADQSEKYLFCQTHSHEQLKIYCHTCDKLTCRDCQLIFHKDHKYQFLDKTCTEEKIHITELVEKIKEKQFGLDSSSVLLSKRNEEILQREKDIAQELKVFAVKFITDINKRTKTLVQEVYKVCSEKKDQLNIQNQELTTFSERLNHCKKFAEAAMNLGSETALVYSKKPIMTQLMRVLKYRCEYPNPNDVVDIVFNYETNFLTQYISNLGQILVDRQPIPGSASNQNAMLPMPRTVQSPVLNTPPAPVPRQPPAQMQVVQQPRMVQQIVNQHPVQQMNQQAMTPYGQPQVTSSTDLNRNHQMRQINKQMQYNRNHMQQRVNVPQTPQTGFGMQGNNAITQNQMLQQSVAQQMRQHSQVQQRQQPQQHQQIQHQQIQQQQQQQQQQQPQQIQQTNFNNTAQLPIPLRQNKSISVTAVPSPSGPSPNKQRAIAPRNLNMSVVNNQASPSVQRSNSNQTAQRSNAPQVIVLDDQPNQKTPTMSNTTRLSHFPNNIAATLAANHPNLQIQPTGFNNSSKF